MLFFFNFFLFFNVDNESLAFHRSLKSTRSRQSDWNRIQKKKIASFRCWHEVRRSEICTRSAGRKKISHDSIFKRREETKSHFVLFEKKKDLFERKENRVETIDYYSRNFLFNRVVIIALIQKVERSLLYFLRASVISFEIRESKQFFSRALVDFFFWLFNQSKCLSVSRVTCFTCSLHFHRDKNITKYQVSNVGLRELENRYMTFLFFFFSFFSVGTWNPSDSVHCFVKVEYRNKWKDQPFSPPSCRVVSVDKISRFLFHIQATRFCIRKEGLGLTRVSVFCIYVQLSWKYYVRNTGCVNTGCGETRSARFSFLPSRSLNY